MHKIEALPGGDRALQLVYSNAPYFGVDAADMSSTEAISFRRDLKIVLEQLKMEANREWDVYDRWVSQRWVAIIF